MSSPSKAIGIPVRPSAIEGTPSGSFVGTPDQRAAIRAGGYVGTPPRNIPMRTAGTPPIQRAGSPGTSLHPPHDSLRRMSTTESGIETPADVDLDNLDDEERAKVIRRHLVSHGERTEGDASATRREDSETFPIPYHAPGADVTHDIYKWQSDQRRSTALRARAVSYSGVPITLPDPAFEHIHEPGGFRRNHLLLRAQEEGAEEPRILNTFIDFLYIFGHYAGEDLEEDEDDKEDEDEESDLFADPSASFQPSADSTERSPLIDRPVPVRSLSRSRIRRRRNSVAAQGDATVTQAVLMLLKSFVGTGVLFLGKAFFNGGILFSTLTLSFICLISLYSFLLLVKTKFVVNGSYGDIGGSLYGPWMRYAILGSIVISQLGFVAAYTIFVAENLKAFVEGVTDCKQSWPVQYFIVLQLVIFTPLAMVRNLAKLSTTALIADAFILFGLVYIFGSEIAVIAEKGLADVKLFNSRDFPLFIGTAVFSFEGIGLVIPITESMREPRKFPKALTGVMMFLLVLFCGGGALSYSAFGSSIQTVVIVNLDGDNKTTQAVQLLYALAIMLSVPLQLFPAVRIMENGLFVRSGKANPKVKWLKNLFRLSVVGACTIVSWLGAADLDKFVSFIGSSACIPLCYIYPAMLHYKACATTRSAKIKDLMLMVFGGIVTMYTTVQTIRLMAGPSGPVPIGRCERI